MKNKLTYENAYQQFKIEFKDEDEFIKKIEKETGVDKTDGAHIQFEMIVVPLLFHLLDVQNESTIKRCFIFFDKMSASSDKELSAVVQFSILEAIISNKDYFNKLKNYFTDEMKSYLPYIRSYIDYEN